MDERLQALAWAKREQRGRWRRRARLAVLFIASLLLANALIGDRGLVGLVRLRGESAALQNATATLRQENARLREEARRLREDPAAIEDVARRELGLVKPGERVVLVDLDREK